MHLKMVDYANSCTTLQKGKLNGEKYLYVHWWNYNSGCGWCIIFTFLALKELTLASIMSFKWRTYDKYNPLKKGCKKVRIECGMYTKF